jgi:hypothetical protein
MIHPAVGIDFARTLKPELGDGGSRRIMMLQLRLKQLSGGQGVGEGVMGSVTRQSATGGKLKYARSRGSRLFRASVANWVRQSWLTGLPTETSHSWRPRHLSILPPAMYTGLNCVRNRVSIAQKGLSVLDNLKRVAQMPTLKSGELPRRDLVVGRRPRLNLARLMTNAYHGDELQGIKEVVGHPLGDQVRFFDVVQTFSGVEGRRPAGKGVHSHEVADGGGAALFKIEGAAVFAVVFQHELPEKAQRRYATGRRDLPPCGRQTRHSARTGRETAPRQ